MIFFELKFVPDCSRAGAVRGSLFVGVDQHLSPDAPETLIREASPYAQHGRRQPLHLRSTFQLSECKVTDRNVPA
jgi:hypothetical protein